MAQNAVLKSPLASRTISAHQYTCHIPSRPPPARKTGCWVKEPELENRTLVDQQTSQPIKRPAVLLADPTPPFRIRWASPPLQTSNRRGTGPKRGLEIRRPSRYIRLFTSASLMVSPSLCQNKVRRPSIDRSRRDSLHVTVSASSPSSAVTLPASHPSAPPRLRVIPFPNPQFSSSPVLIHPLLLLRALRVLRGPLQQSSPTTTASPHWLKNSR
jgi:hypothetical protein